MHTRAEEGEGAECPLRDSSTGEKAKREKKRKKGKKNKWIPFLSKSSLHAESGRRMD